jgi:putative ABC transport system permease protein
MIWISSWRNIWRNKFRSMVVIVAVTLGLIAGVFTTAFMRGLSEQRIRSAIETEMSHIQIHRKGFTDNMDFKYYFTGVEDIIRMLEKQSDVQAASKRMVLNAMLATSETITGAKIIAVDTEKEMQVCNIHEKIIEGEYFRDYRRNPSVLIGEKLAEKLDVKLNKGLVMSMADKEGNTIQARFKVAGIYKTENSTFDEMHVFVRFHELARLCSFKEDAAHEIVIALKDHARVDIMTKQIQNILPASLEAENWMQISPEMGYLVSAMDQYMYFFVILILLALCFGIINTMLMVVMERVKELGMLMAIGMTRTKIFLMITLESVFLSLTGGIAGIVLGFLISKYYSVHGIVLPGAYKEGLEVLGYSTLIHPSLNFQMILIIAVMVVLTGILSSLYPAYKALRLDPAQALKMEN